MRLHGHLVEVDWDGEVLAVRGTNPDGRVLVNAGTDDGRLSLPADQIEAVVFRDAPRMVGGVLLVRDTSGGEHRLHFRRGGREAFHVLYEELASVVARSGHEVDLTDAGSREPGPGLSAYGDALRA